ncbi:hypothetical protein ACTMTF_44375 [Nonomuraea sp. ZG12]|uniref:hypothetical protein n=1 Tax=Nonomuraea sp. ZG12 TaxID=3452207 RepID=UPI003F8B1BD3
MAVFISRRHACHQAKLVHHPRGRNLDRMASSVTAVPPMIFPWLRAEVSAAVFLLQRASVTFLGFPFRPTCKRRSTPGGIVGCGGDLRE